VKNYLIMGLIFALLIASGCAGTEKPEQKSGEPIKIGVLVSYTGSLGTYGQGMARGAELARDEINRKGIKGSNVTLIIEDTGSDATKATDAARKLINVDKVQVIIGAVSSTETLAIAPIANQNKVVVISATSTAASVTDAGDYIFRVVGSDALQGEAMAKVAEKKNYTKAATLVQNNDYGKGLEAVIKSKFNGTVVKSVQYGTGRTDYKTELQGIKEANPDVIMFVGYPAEASMILLDSKKIDLNVPWIAAEGIADPKMFENPEVAARMEGMLLTRPASTAENPDYKNFVSVHKQVYGVEPGIYADTYYDATMLAALAIENSGNDGEKIKNALPVISRTYKGVSGNKPFDKNGDVPQDYAILEVKNKAMVTIGSWNPAAGVTLQ